MNRFITCYQLAAIAFVLFLAGCNKDETAPLPGMTATVSDYPSIAIHIIPDIWKSTTAIATLSNATQRLEINGKIVNDTFLVSYISLAIPHFNSTPGTFVIEDSSAQAYFDNEDFPGTPFPKYTAISGSVEITSILAGHIKGTFHFATQPITYSNGIVYPGVTNGTFSVQLMMVP